MALKLFRRKSKEPKADVKAEKKVKVDKKVVEVRSRFSLERDGCKSYVAMLNFCKMITE